MESAAWGFIGTLLGTLVGGCVSIATTTISARNASKIHSLKTKDEREERARAFQRETLLITQETLQDLMRLASRIYLADKISFRRNGKWDKNIIDDDLDESFRATNQKLSCQIQRIFDESLRNKLKDQHALISNISLSESEIDAEIALHAAGGNFEIVTEELGALLRANY